MYRQRRNYNNPSERESEQNKKYGFNRQSTTGNRNFGSDEDEPPRTNRASNFKPVSQHSQHLHQRERNFRDRRNDGNYQSRDNDNRNPEEKRFKRKYPLGFKKLEEFLNEPPENVLMKLIENFDGLLLLLDVPDLSANFIILIVRAVVKMSDSYFEQHKIKILHQLVEDNFMKQLKLFVNQLHLQDERDRYRANYFWENPERFFNDLYVFCETIVKIIPSRGSAVLPKLLKAASFEIPFLKINDNGNELYDKFLKLENDLETEIEKFHNKHKKKVHNLNQNEAEPPNDFRTIPVYPKAIEITTNMKPFLRENIIDGGYKNVEHYLDVQFRLVRNDFVKPLKDGIVTYLDPEKTEKPQNIKVYNGVTFLKPEMCANSSNAYLIQMPKPKEGFKLKLENSRLFMYGSLICFTRNRFKTIIFGRIVNRDIELLKTSRLVVALDFNTETIHFNEQYTMIESKVYFEPYYHVLTALQQLDEDDFPMKQYIVDMKLDNGVPEYYLNKLNVDENNRMTLIDSDLDDEEMLERDDLEIANLVNIQIFEKYRIPIIDGVIIENKWATMETLKLNEGQYRAYKNALSRKFSIIQGPPGTGKTHLGLIVAKTLLYNHKIWHENTHPMLIICYTNHALDQFLEGLLSTTNKIVRIGGQSKSKALEKYNLKNVRNEFFNRHLLRDHQSEIRSCGQTLKEFYDILHAVREFNGIVNIIPLLSKLPNTNVWSKIRNLTKGEFKKWLLGGNIQKQPDKFDIDQTNELFERVFGKYDNPDRDDEIYTDDEDENMFQKLFETAQENDNRNIDDDVINFNCTGASVYIVTLESYANDLEYLDREANKLRNLGDQVEPKRWFLLERDYQEKQSECDYLTNGLEYIKNIPNEEQVSQDLINQLENPNVIVPEDRWKLYLYWMKMYEKQVMKQMQETEDEYQKACKEYEDVKMMIDTDLLRKKMVIGMTTTGAARLQSLLKSLRSRVVIVEEAAEIMEAHIVTSLTRHCEHLILIGDHQQLRPSTSDYLMETKYNLGISLFERMIRNKVECNVLEIQHRMRPEFAKLIVPTIYPTLENHESVYEFPPMKGVRKNLYFINHKHEENKEKDDSKFNMHEIEYLLHLAEYLILNGYTPEDITILCAYSAQLFKMFAERKNFPLLRDIRICVLDNYQGEESKIILLSLVRNNKENKVGFLKIDNRVCVALSRAREGFYIMGNIEMLSQASPDIWGKIQKTLQDQESLGDALPLSCEVHREKITYIKTIDDFKKVAEGGCDEICNMLLRCGHFCKIQCHTTDREHAVSRCREKCIKILCDDEHPCPKMCSEECGPCMVGIQKQLSCGHTGVFACSDRIFKCQEIAPVTLSCGHETEKSCYLPIEKVICPYPCDVRVDSCGHACMLKCHVNNDPDHLKYECPRKCDRKLAGCTSETEEHLCGKMCCQECDECDVIVKKYRSCGHVYSMKCRENVETIRCTRPCKDKLPCGHDCEQKCFQPCGNCEVLVVKSVPECGHTIRIPCKETPTKSRCKGKCPLILQCGHPCKEMCKQPCTTKCNSLTKSVCPLPCGHYADIPCLLNTQSEIESNTTLLNYCQAPCNVTLKCKHTCGGNCGECYQGRIHKVCSSDCGVPLVCGHVCKTPCRAECPPCNQKCQVRCPHTRCGKKCGDICTPCKERCTRQCVHQRCGNKCDEICSVGPCYQPCFKLLRCKHPCIGFCGDPCPPLCRICNKNVVTEIFFGTEDEENARFVLLVDCKHIVESQGMDMWMNEGKKGEITSKCCPKCKTPVINTRRYADYVKETLRSVMDVKKRFYGNLDDNIRIGKAHIKRLDELCGTSLIEIVYPQISSIQRLFESQLKPVRQGQRQMLSKSIVDATIAKIQILENICNICDLYQKYLGSSLLDLIKLIKNRPKSGNYMHLLLNRLKTNPQRMTEQEIEDFEFELKRLRRIVQFESISNRLPARKLQSLEYINLQAKIYKLGRYKDEDDASIKNELKTFSDSIGNFDVSETELKQIIKVIGVRSGAWYKCPNGHIYAIGECGGAMETGKCPDCGEVIGGRNHQLVGSNSHANVDGSTHAAWSQQANMANYRF